METENKGCLQINIMATSWILAFRFPSCHCWNISNLLPKSALQLVSLALNLYVPDAVDLPRNSNEILCGQTESDNR
jgi:hypothetical protein